MKRSLHRWLFRFVVRQLQRWDRHPIVSRFFVGAALALISCQSFDDLPQRRGCQ
jgi:hypothetical protein